MVQITASISKELDQLNTKYQELQPHLDEIDQVTLILLEVIKLHLISNRILQSKMLSLSFS